MEQAKTIFLLALLSVIFVFIGFAVGGSGGALIALLIAGGMNFYAYYYSDKQVLAHYNAQEITDPHHYAYRIVERLAQKANLPMPRVYMVPDSTPNAFATGRNPQNAAVAMTEGLVNLLSEHEIEGVLAHELSHVRHYDMLVGTVAATIAGAIAFIANIMQFGAMFGGDRDRGMNPIVMLLLSIVLPIAAMVIQMSVSRSREYMADEGAARLTNHPEWLQSALSKLENYAHNRVMDNATPESAHMFIINPFSGHEMNFASLFRTHPSTQDRIARLDELKHAMR